MYSTGHAKEGTTPLGITTDSSLDLLDRRRPDPAARHGEQLHAIRERLPLLVHYQAVVGVLGKAGAGKSALCNALSGQECAEVSDVDVCTRYPLEITLSYRDGNGLSLLDVPGMGESTAHDKDYAELYRRLLPELDLILWVIKGDDRALSVDEQVYRDIVRPYAERHCVPVMVVISQIDKIEPSQEWDWSHHHPGPQQAANAQNKRRSVCRLLAVPPAQVCMVSARAGYGLVDLVEAMMHRGDNITPVLCPDMTSASGWLLPDGKYYGCGSMEHIGLAEALLAENHPTSVGQFGAEAVAESYG